MNQLAVINQNIISEINSAHELAQQASKTAIEHGIRAGELLLQVKESLPHGTFSAWLSENITVSERQAQRYMRHAKGLPVLRSLKNDTVSFLNYGTDSFAKIVAETVAQKIAIERAKELAKPAKGINANYSEFLKNRDGLINVLLAMKTLHVGSYWTRLVELSKDESKSVAMFAYFSRESIESIECDEKCAIIINDMIHASLVESISLMNEIRDRKGYAVLGYESFDDYVKNEHLDTDLEHLERYQKIPIYSEIVTSIQAFKTKQAA